MTNIEEKKDWTSDELNALNEKEKHKMFVDTFKYKPDWLSSKILLSQSKMGREELNLLNSSPDEDLTEFLFKNEQCG